MKSLLYPLESVTITQKFGENPQLYKPNYKGHMGVDFRARTPLEVLASHDGKVRLKTDVDSSGKIGGYGYNIELVDSTGFFTKYGHLSKFLVKDGQVVRTGQKIALTGNSGYSTAPHLHFGLMPKSPNYGNGYGGYIDPLPYLTNNVNPEDEMLKDWLDVNALSKMRAIAGVKKDKIPQTDKDLKDFLNQSYGSKKIGDLTGREFVDAFFKSEDRLEKVKEYEDLKKGVPAKKLDQIKKIVNS